ncbi:hypothetical protein J5U46_07910 [Micromonospora tulbaghiae]|uniref:Uncharacterized protein n=1 Tax=Micromonospora tulbaghiae TaxID=479978 RepID=A0AAW4JJW0_9ACTN|nr:hypothetical protein [Micromonospora tulbaghiae]MBO4140068.1 hypothetical protein [Micromonospora tulbaghiae]
MTAESYMSPDGFRLNLNALIQNLRNVTWLLQKRKSNFANFQEWYGAWQDSVKSDPVMGWIVQARNRIVKEADLEIHSEAKVRISLDWTHEFEKTLQFPPRFNTRQILAGILTANAIPPAGTITINRRWVDRGLPEWELLDATSHAYDQIARVIYTTHQEAGVQSCDLPSRQTSCVSSDIKRSMICMDSADENRLLHVDLHSGDRITESRVAFDGDSDELTRRALKKYGGKFDVGSGDAIDRLPGLLKNAKMVLQVDKSHITFAYHLIDDRIVAHLPIAFSDQAAKRLAIQRLAEEARRARANGLIFVGEQWVAFVKPGEDLRHPSVVPARERPDRKEAIAVTGMTKDGRIKQLQSIFERDEQGNITFWPEVEKEYDHVPNFLLPIARVWGIGPFREAPPAAP